MGWVQLPQGYNTTLMEQPFFNVSGGPGSHYIDFKWIEG